MSQDYTFILLSGGIGKRMRETVPKQFLHLAGRPIFIHVLEKVDVIDGVKEIVMPCPEAFIEKTEDVINSYGFETPIRCISGGNSRQESVYKGLMEATYDNVIIHEAVRPFVTVEDYRKLINAKGENAIFGIDIPFTVLQGKEVVEGNLKRDELINVQLPHKYSKAKLLYAHECAQEDGLTFTDDASLHYHYFQGDIDILEGHEQNIKITKPIDRVIAEAIYHENK